MSEQMRKSDEMAPREMRARKRVSALALVTPLVFMTIQETVLKQVLE
jgi:hypothetical protein